MHVWSMAKQTCVCLRYCRWLHVTRSLHQSDFRPCSVWCAAIVVVGGCCTLVLFWTYPVASVLSGSSTHSPNTVWLHHTYTHTLPRHTHMKRAVRPGWRASMRRGTTGYLARVS